MKDKGFHLFDECTATCVHLSPQEEECTWGDGKMYASGRIVNSDRTLTEINKSGAIAKIRTWVESDSVKQWKHLE